MFYFFFWNRGNRLGNWEGGGGEFTYIDSTCTVNMWVPPGPYPRNGRICLPPIQCNSARYWTPLLREWYKCFTQNCTLIQNPTGAPTLFESLSQASWFIGQLQFLRVWFQICRPHTLIRSKCECPPPPGHGLALNGCIHEK